MKPAEISRLESFAQDAGRAHWRVESSTLIDLIQCSKRDGGRFHLRSRGKRDGVDYCQLEWLGVGYEWADVMRDFWCDYLSGADRDLFFSRRTDDGEPGLTVIAGDREHGHVIRVGFVGERITHLVRRCAKNAC